MVFLSAFTNTTHKDEKRGQKMEKIFWHLEKQELQC